MRVHKYFHEGFCTWSSSIYEEVSVDPILLFLLPTLAFHYILLVTNSSFISSCLAFIHCSLNLSLSALQGDVSVITSSFATIRKFSCRSEIFPLIQYILFIPFVKETVAVAWPLRPKYSTIMHHDIQCINLLIQALYLNKCSYFF